MSHKKNIVKIPRCLSWRSKTLASQALKPNVMIQHLKNDKKSMNKGENSFYNMSNSKYNMRLDR
jgi:hypothetical protein